MKGLWLLVCLVPFAVEAEPLSYDYVYLSSNDAETGSSSGDSGETLGGFWEFADTLHLFGSYDDSSAYVAAGANPDWDYDTRTLRFGIGAHYLLGERTMIAPSIAVLRARREITAPAWSTPREDEDTGYSAQLDLRHALSDRLEITAGARYSKIFDRSDSELVGGLVFHATDRLALGALHHEGEEEAGMEVTVKWYF